MDDIQRTLVNAGRKDLAQEYYKKISKEDESIAEKDMKAAEALRPQLEKMFDNIEKLNDTINKKLSDFNSPGLRSAFLESLKTGIRGQSYQAGPAKRMLDRYFRR